MRTVTVVANAEVLHGGELHLCMQMRMLLLAGCRVVFRPYTTPPVNPAILIPAGVEIGPQFGAEPVEPCDVLFVLANNATIGVDARRMAWTQAAAAARFRFLLLNWQIRDAREPWFARLWDRVGFLSTTLRDEWCALTGRPEAETCVRAPAVDLAPYLAIHRDYSQPVFVRLSMPGKWPSDTPAMMGVIRRACPSARFEAMGMPNSMRGPGREAAPLVWLPPWSESRYEFLRRGSVFWYPLRYGFTDQGPRVIVEAMAAGLAVIADNRDGAKDRITPETGWLCDSHSEYEAVAREIASDPGVLRRKGEAARQRARTVFAPEGWLPEIMGDTQQAKEAA